MDLKKAKIILIIVLFLLNTGLFIALFNSEILPGIQDEEIDIEKILLNRGVEVKCELLSGDITAAWLYISPVDYTGHDIAENIFADGYETVNESFSIKYSGSDLDIVFKNDDVCIIKFKNAEETDNLDFEGIKEKVLPIINKAVGFEGDIELDNYNYYENGETYITYIQKYKGYKFFDNYIKVMADPEGIKEIEFIIRKINDFEKVLDRKLISVNSILISNLVNMDGMAVVGMETGFKNNGISDTGLLNKQIGLSLRIYLSDGSFKYYSMINGKEIND